MLPHSLGLESSVFYPCLAMVIRVEAPGREAMITVTQTLLVFPSVFILPPPPSPPIIPNQFQAPRAGWRRSHSRSHQTNTLQRVTLWSGTARPGKEKPAPGMGGQPFQGLGPPGS